MPKQQAVKSRVIHSAYLIVICDKHSNRILEVAIWSDPPWEKSRPIYHNAFVAYECQGETYQEAKNQLLESLFRKYSRNRWLAEHITSRTATTEEIERAQAAAAEYDKLVFGDDEPTGEGDQ